MADSSFPVSSGGGQWQAMRLELQTLENANQGKGDKHVRAAAGDTAIYVHGDQRHSLVSPQPKYRAGVAQVKAALDHDFGPGFGDFAFRKLGKTKGFFEAHPDKGLKLKDIGRLDRIVQDHGAAYRSEHGGGLDLSPYPAADQTSNPRLLRDVLAGTDPALTGAFEEHCRSRLVDADLTFLRDVQAFRRNPSLGEAQRLYAAYVDPDGSTALNLDGPERDAVFSRLDGARQVPGDLFDGAFATVFDQMVQDQADKFRAANG